MYEQNILKMKNMPFFRPKCINEPVVKAEAISENLQECAQRICFLPLQDFLERCVVVFFLTINLCDLLLLLLLCMLSVC